MNGNDGGDHDKLYFEMISKVYAGIQEQIRFADTKAGFVAAFNAILIGFIAGNLGTIKDIYRTTHNWNACLWLMALSLLMVIPTAISIVYLIWAVRPRLGQNTHKSRIFFGHIAPDYRLDGVRYRNDVRGMKQEDWADDYGYQIVEVANIAQQKHSNVRTSMNWSFSAFVALVVISLTIHAIAVFYNPTIGQPTRAEIERMDGSVFLKFGATWCRHCQAFAPQLALLLEGYPDVQHIKVEDGPGKPLGRSFGIKLWPTLVFLRHGKVVKQIARPGLGVVREGWR